MSDPRYCHGWEDECRRVPCSCCGQDMEDVYDPKVRDTCDGCGGTPNGFWAKEMRQLVEQRREWRKSRGI